MVEAVLIVRLRQIACGAVLEQRARVSPPSNLKIDSREFRLQPLLGLLLG